MYNSPLFADRWTPKQKTFLKIFLHLLPLEFLTNVIIEATSSALFTADSARTSLGEMLWYFGMWMLMLCYMKSPNYFWQSAAQMAGDGVEDEENGIPSFHLQPLHVAAAVPCYHISVAVHVVKPADVLR